MKKVESSKRDIDKKSKYYINLSTDTPDGVGQCIIPINNIRYNIIIFFYKFNKKKNFILIYW